MYSRPDTQRITSTERRHILKDIKIKAMPTDHSYNDDESDDMDTRHILGALVINGLFWCMVIAATLAVLWRLIFGR